MQKFRSFRQRNRGQPRVKPQRRAVITPREDIRLLVFLRPKEAQRLGVSEEEIQNARKKYLETRRISRGEIEHVFDKILDMENYDRAEFRRVRSFSRANYSGMSLKEYLDGVVTFRRTINRLPNLETSVKKLVIDAGLYPLQYILVTDMLRARGIAATEQEIKSLLQRRAATIEQIIESNVIEDALKRYRQRLNKVARDDRERQEAIRRQPYLMPTPVQTQPKRAEERTNHPTAQKVLAEKPKTRRQLPPKQRFANAISEILTGIDLQQIQRHINRNEGLTNSQYESLIERVQTNHPRNIGQVIEMIDLLLGKRRR